MVLCVRGYGGTVCKGLWWYCVLGVMVVLCVRGYGGTVCKGLWWYCV